MKNFLRSIPGKVVLYTAFTLLSLLVIACFVIALIANEGELYAKSYNESRNDIIENQIKYEMHNFAWASLCHNVAYSDCDVPMVITDSNEEVVAENKNAYTDINLPDIKIFIETITYVKSDNDFGGTTEYIDEYVEFADTGNGTLYTITAYYLPGMHVNSDCYFYLLILGVIDTFKVACYPVGIIALLLMILTFVALMSVSAHTNKTEEFTPGYFTKLPIEIALVLATGVVTLAILIFAEMIDNTYAMGYFPALIAVGVLCASVSIITCVLLASTIAARIKLKTLFSSSIICRILMWIGKLIKRIFKAILYSISNMGLFWKVALTTFGIVFVEFVLAVLAFTEPDVSIFFWFIEKIALVAFIFYITSGLVKLSKAGEAIASGDTDYEINYKHLHMDFKKHADNLKSINQGIQNAITSKLRSEHMKTELITNVSHDIKTPLTSIINYAGLISNEKSDNPKISEYSEVLVKQSDKLKRLIEDLVEASKANTGNLEVNPVPVDAGTILMQASGEYEEKLQAANLTLITNQPEHEIMINADPRRMWRVFDNLMNNICKYSLPGSRVYLELIETEKQAIFTFKNTSKEALNISPDELMERFVRGDKSRNTEGNGLGLSIAKSLTELQNGTLDLNIDGDLFKATLTFPKI